MATTRQAFPSLGILYIEIAYTSPRFAKRGGFFKHLKHTQKFFGCLRRSLVDSVTGVFAWCRTKYPPVWRVAADIFSINKKVRPGHLLNMPEEEALSRISVLFRKNKKRSMVFFTPLHYSPHALQTQGKSVRLKIFFFYVSRGGRIFDRGGKTQIEPHLKCPHAHVFNHTDLRTHG